MNHVSFHLAATIKAPPSFQILDRFACSVVFENTPCGSWPFFDQGVARLCTRADRGLPVREERKCALYRGTWVRQQQCSLFWFSFIVASRSLVICHEPKMVLFVPNCRLPDSQDFRVIFTGFLCVFSPLRQRQLADHRIFV